MKHGKLESKIRLTDDVTGTQQRNRTADAIVLCTTFATDTQSVTPIVCQFTVLRNMYNIHSILVN